MINFILFIHLLTTDLSFLVADLKYNQKDGVKICEVQQGMISNFNGSDEIEGKKGVIGAQAAQFIGQHFKQVYFIHPAVPDPNVNRAFRKMGWVGFPTMKELLEDKTFLDLAINNDEDSSLLLITSPSRIENLELFNLENAVQGNEVMQDLDSEPSLKGVDHSQMVKATPFKIGYGSRDCVNSLPSTAFSRFNLEFPAVSILDLATYPVWGDKYKMSVLFKSDQILQDIKPQWGCYPKKYSENLAQTIQNDIPGDYLVIKPRGSSRGSGVIVVERILLDDTLKLILNDKEKLKKMEDDSYQHWSRDRYDSFIVEEFIPSDPIIKKNKPYDATMRVVFFMTSQNGEINYHTIGAYLKLPPASLTKKKSLNSNHKSLAVKGNYAKVPPEVLEQVELQLKPAMLKLYEDML